MEQHGQPIAEGHLRSFRRIFTDKRFKIAQFCIGVLEIPLLSIHISRRHEEDTTTRARFPFGDACFSETA